MGDRAIAALSNSRALEERLIAGTGLYFAGQGNVNYLQELVDVCPPSYFVDLRAKELIETSLAVAEQKSLSI